MSSPRPGPSTAQSPLQLDISDLTNYETFMESLICFMNESAHAVLQVKKKSGVSPECLSPVKMTDEDKQQKMNDILLNLSQQYQAEASTLSSTANTSAYQTALDTTADTTAFQSAHDTAFSVPSSPSDCTCPPETPPPRQSPRGRRADTPRPGTTPVRGRVATPDPYFIPLSQSSMNSPSGCPATSPSTSGASRASPRARGRTTQSPYSTMIDSGGLPYAYQSGTPPFANTTSMSGRNLNSYSNMTSSSGFSGACPRECTVGSVNSTGRQQYRVPKGAQNNWDWKQENRTV